ncbi:hypothetical protein BJ741DRAFT_291959 [Chytriomyces cf. hyalinus JEL632]|nr:hypothetical protein BJ741DRAFT_291959 [Chytriomyces cf. hyalinus JEL632]
MMVQLNPWVLWVQMGDRLTAAVAVDVVAGAKDWSFQLAHHHQQALQAPIATAEEEIASCCFAWAAWHFASWAAVVAAAVVERGRLAVDSFAAFVPSEQAVPLARTQHVKTGEYKLGKGTNQLTRPESACARRALHPDGSYRCLWN